MKTDEVNLNDLAASAIVVPPLARHSDLRLNREENQKLISHIEQGSVTTLMYGGNANFYNIPLSEYADTLSFLADAVGEETWLIPSAGPDYGRLMDQALILREMSFPAVMALPQSSAATPVGVDTALRRFCERLRRPIILYLKQDDYLSAESVGRLVEDGIICGIKYAIVREDPAQDEYLRKLLDRVDSRYLVSGIGERPAIVHVRDFGLSSFTTGCGAIAPRASATLLDALQMGDYGHAEAIQSAFLPLEDWRDAIHPIRVLHQAVSLSGIAEMGPILPLLHDLEKEYWPKVKQDTEALLTYNETMIRESIAIDS